MSNVINVCFNNKSVYEAGRSGTISVKNKTTGLVIDSESLTNDLIGIQIGEERSNICRKELAEFLWMAAYMLDGEQKWCPRELPSMNYKSNGVSQ